MTSPLLSNYILDKIITDIDAGEYYIAVSNVNEPLANTVSYNAPNTQDVGNNLIFGKKVKTTHRALIIPTNVWETGTIYEQSSKQLTNQFYVINQNDDVFKCIWNADNAASTSEPITKSTTMIETADGYIWKYMYSIGSSEMTLFNFNGYIPVIANTSVSGNAVPGTIDYVEVLDKGSDYTAWNEGLVKEVISNKVYRIDDTASAVINIYKDSAIYVKNGTNMGLLSNISSSYSNSSGNYITFSANTTLSTDSEYIISPKVVTTDNKGSGFSAYSTVDENNAINKIIIIENGSDYIDPAITLYTSVDANTASLSPIVSPVEGHGYDAARELNCGKLVLTTSFGELESDTLPDDLVFHSSALIYNPNVAVSAQNTASWGISIDVANTYSVGDNISGSVTGATGTVYWANTSHIKLNKLNGVFANNDVISNESGSNSAINITKIADTFDYGNILEYVNHDPIYRANNTAEEIKFVINLESN